MAHLAHPWVDKYRPRTVADVAHQEEVVRALQKAMQSSNLPHLLFYGPPGTGKTSTALALARQLYGPELAKARVKELNASDERGISVVREKIKAFAATSVGQPVAGYPCPPFKLLILDEADAMTQDAQNALRRTMEAHSKVTRFIFICNYVSRIIDPLASRCAKFRFQPLHGGIMSARIAHICKEEGVTLEAGAMDTLGKVAGGDMRKAITTLQSAVRLRGMKVEPQTLLDVSGAVPESVTSSVLEACHNRGFSGIQEAITDAIASGWGAQQLLLELQAGILRDTSLKDKQRACICTALAEADKCLVDGSDEFLQLLHVASVAQMSIQGTA
ncbi:g509 [Coccomyxa viridis]|uniref:G509 protein n=1 Tax=Coccomyxa viridis TaxID=1274662 RepID=A0ABP1FMJ9_9CHLO